MTTLTLSLKNIPLSPGLYIVGTPIGNLGDITLRALDTLNQVDVILCEDTRVTRKLLGFYGIKKPLFIYNDHNAPKVRSNILEKLLQGQSAALVSDAGMPLISDPGYKLVTACYEQEIQVTVLPGPSASLTALLLSGLPSDHFYFGGFLPIKQKARLDFLKEIENLRATLIFYETAPRLDRTLQTLYQAYGERPAVVGRELTKKFEEVKRGNLSDLISFYKQKGPPKGEIVIMVGYKEQAERGFITDQLYKETLEQFSLKEAADVLSKKFNHSKREIYKELLRIKNALS